MEILEKWKFWKNQNFGKIKILKKSKFWKNQNFGKIKIWKKKIIFDKKFKIFQNF